MPMPDYQGQWRDMNERPMPPAPWNPMQVHRRDVQAYREYHNTHRVLTVFYECTLELPYDQPGDYNPIWRWAGYKRSAPPGGPWTTAPVFERNISMNQLMRLSFWHGSMMFE